MSASQPFSGSLESDQQVTTSAASIPSVSRSSYFSSIKLSTRAFVTACLYRNKSAAAAHTSSMPSHALPAFLTQSKTDIHGKFVDLEWQQRERLLHGTLATPTSPASSPWSRLQGESITARNRYMNVEPYAANRIKLQVLEGENDYINASPITLGRRRYIATQGPKDSSVNHFYRMLAAEVQSPAVVVMLTQTHEAGREKCFQYYPLSAEESPLNIPEEDGFAGEVELESVEDHAGSRSQLRRLKLRTSSGDGAKEIEIKHLLFSGWPDFLIPEGEDRTALVSLVHLSAELNRTTPDESQEQNGMNGTYQDNPRIIHCSAGVGRSGTFIALDYLLSLLHSGQLDNLAPDRDPIAETVDELRQQRMMMVQGEGQFFFLYEVLKEEVAKRAQIQGQ